MTFDAFDFVQKQNLRPYFKAGVSGIWKYRESYPWPEPNFKEVNKQFLELTARDPRVPNRGHFVFFLIAPSVLRQFLSRPNGSAIEGFGKMQAHETTFIISYHLRSNVASPTRKDLMAHFYTNE